MNRFTIHVLVLGSITVLSFVVYFPIVNNSFISDDFGIFPFLEALEQNPAYIFDAPSELFRLTSYVYFWGLFKTFGSVPEPFYVAGIALHAFVSILVCLLVRRITGSTLAAWAAGSFFAAYERHQEAVMWISAANETILALNCLLFLLLWEYAISRENPRHLASAATLIVFALALFSKEAAVVMAPMALIALLRHGYRGSDILGRSIPVFALAMAFVVMWLWQADRNFFITDGHYAAGFHFAPVFGRAVIRLVLPTIPFVGALMWLWFRPQTAQRLRMQLYWPGIVFFGLLLLLGPVPYSFLTYQDHLPSRHTYLASVGLAGVVGILFAMVRTLLASKQSKQICTGAFAALVLANVGYVWLKKEPQFQERAAPTRELLNVLNSASGQAELPIPLNVCGFPLGHPWWFADAISRFSSRSGGDVVLRDQCVNSTAATGLMWDSNAVTYVKVINQRDSSITVDVADGKSK